jgi:hypothetical protein
MEGDDCDLFVDFRDFPGATYENQKPSRMASLWNKTLNPRSRSKEALDCGFGALLSYLPPSSGTKD